MKEAEPIEDVELPEPGGFFEKLAEKLGAVAQATRIFGEPVERDGVTVIPVATARLGLGGGGGKRGLAARHQGMGGGGGVVIQPAGYIEIKGGETRYRPIVDFKLAIGAALAGGFLLLGLVKRLRG
ncbi:MAG TPA: spore germination protein GerW family protein [Thermoanaerobaculia bacterium]|jgi:uncharacterized spore protein YtfJ